jgi:hypothetical protein
MKRAWRIDQSKSDLPTQGFVSAASEDRLYSAMAHSFASTQIGMHV